MYCGIWNDSLKGKTSKKKNPPYYFLTDAPLLTVNDSAVMNVNAPWLANWSLFKNQEHNSVYPTLLSHKAHIVSWQLHCQHVRKSCWFLLCNLSPLPTSVIRGYSPWSAPAFISTHLPHLQEVSPLPEAYLQSVASNWFFWNQFCLWGTLLLCTSSSFLAPENPSLPSLRVYMKKYELDEPSNWWFCLMPLCYLDDSECATWFWSGC